MPNVQLLSMTVDPLTLIRRAMGECYQRPLGVKTVQKAIEAGHLSVLEHCYASFESLCLRRYYFNLLDIDTCPLRCRVREAVS